MAENSGATILVVEDDADVQIAVVQVLELSGYRVLSARDGPEALSVLEKKFHSRSCAAFMTLHDSSSPAFSSSTTESDP